MTQKQKRREFLLLLKIAWALLLLVLLPSAASAQKKGDGVIRLDETVIEGRVAKPNAFFINTRRAMVYESMMVKESFVPEISKAVRNGPF
jgi:hypothetical protein